MHILIAVQFALPLWMRLECCKFYFRKVINQFVFVIANLLQSIAHTGGTVTGTNKDTIILSAKLEDVCGISLKIWPMQSLFSWFKTTFQCKLSRKLHARNLIRFFILVSPSKSNTSENMCLMELVQTYPHPYDLILLCSHCCHFCCVIERMVQHLFTYSSKQRGRCCNVHKQYTVVQPFQTCEEQRWTSPRVYCGF